jgi:CheY-like chemotaxis protein
MGGDVLLSSELGVGSTFSLDLKRPDLGSVSLGLHALIVEDNRVNQHVLRAMLTRIGCTSRVASDGFEALSALDEEDYDVVLSDLQMPGMDGIELARRILERPDPPVLVAVTAEDLPERHRACREAGMSGVLTKPLELNQLQSTLQQLLKGMHP